MSTSESTLRLAIPVLPSLDVARTVAWYADRLGFRARFATDDYAGVARDGVQIHFWKCADPSVAKVTSCRVEVTGIDPLYDELRRKDAIHPNGALETKPWGFREFTVIDDQGNALVFVEPT
jgi:catechol 2,3-dioxygenase-like lactoylglutathione lyase family enzyme